MDYFIHSEITLEDLAELYKGKKGCSFPNLRKRSAREKWIERRNKNDTKLEQKVAEKVVEKKADIIASDLSWRGMFRNTMREEMLSVVNDIKLARQSGLIGLTVQDGEGFLNKAYENYQKGAIDLLKEMEKHDMKMEQLAAAKPTEPEPPQGKQPMSYTDIWRKINSLSETEQILFVAGQLDLEERDDDSTTT